MVPQSNSYFNILALKLVISLNFPCETIFYLKVSLSLKIGYVLNTHLKFLSLWHHFVSQLECGRQSPCRCSQQISVLLCNSKQRSKGMSKSERLSKLFLRLPFTFIIKSKTNTFIFFGYLIKSNVFQKAELNCGQEFA